MFFTLAEVTGNYPVGTTTLAVPVQVAEDEARIIGSALLKSTDGAGNTTPALKLQEVAFTVFYPADLNDITYVRNLPRTAGWTPECVEHFKFLACLTFQATSDQSSTFYEAMPTLES